MSDLNLSSNMHIKSLTGFRFLCAAGIVEWHFRGIYDSSAILGKFCLGQCVSCFFVLSGFIIMYNYSTMQTLRDYIKFLISRFARIYPTHILTFLICMFIILCGINLVEPINSLFSITNILMIQSWYPNREVNAAFNAVSWSISTEFFFYLCFPLLLYVLRKNKIISLLTMLGFTFILIEVTNTYIHDRRAIFPMIDVEGILYNGPIGRVLEFYVGMFICDLYRKYKGTFNKISYIGATVLEICSFLLVLVCFLFFGVYGDWLGENLGLGWQVYLSWSAGSLPAISLLIFVLALGKGKISNILSSKAFVFLGEASFALYMLHWFIVTSLLNKQVITWGGQESSHVLLWIMILLLACGWYLYVETPMRNIVCNLKNICN